jgi:hypothetical protein
MSAHPVFTAIHISTHAHEHCLTALNWTVSHAATLKMEAAHFSESLLTCQFTKLCGVTAAETMADVGPVNTALKRQTLCILFAVDTVALWQVCLTVVYFGFPRQHQSTFAPQSFVYLRNWQRLQINSDYEIILKEQPCRVSLTCNITAGAGVRRLTCM